jgi:DNA invertase Pin-like site-specific DNA recombinase
MRISTTEERELQRYSRQEKALKRYCQENSIDFDFEHNIYKDDKTGTTFEGREQWKKLDKRLKSNDIVIFKDICRFTRSVDEGVPKYMELRRRGIKMIFIDNPTLCSNYIDNMDNAKEECIKRKDNITAITLDFIVRLIITVEIDRAEKEREITVQRIKDGIEASEKKSGRPVGKLDKMSDELKADIKLFLNDRSIKQVDLMKKHNISRNTLKKYIELAKNEK